MKKEREVKERKRRKKRKVEEALSEGKGNREKNARAWGLYLSMQNLVVGEKKELLPNNRESYSSSE